MGASDMQLIWPHHLAVAIQALLRIAQSVCCQGLHSYMQGWGAQGAAYVCKVGGWGVGQGAGWPEGNM